MNLTRILTFLALKDCLLAGLLAFFFWADLEADLDLSRLVLELDLFLFLFWEDI